MKNINELELCDIFSLKKKSPPYMVVKICDLHIECRSLFGNRIYVFYKNNRDVFMRTNFEGYVEAKFFRPEL